MATTLDWVQKARDAAKARRIALGTEPVKTSVTNSADTANTTVGEQTSSMQTDAQRLAELEAQQQSYTEQIASTQAGSGDVRQSAYEKIFGAGSSIQSFYNPSLQAVEQSIASITESLRKLPEDIVTENVDVGLTEAQRRRIEAKRTGELSDTLSELGTSYERLSAGKAEAMALGEMEFNAMVGDAQDQINAAVAELQAKSNLTASQIAEVKARAEQQLSDQVEKKSGVDSILQEAMNTVYSSGITPSPTAFSQVMKDAYAMVESGASLADIQFAVFNAISQNPAVKNYLTGLSSGGGGSSSSGSTRTSTEDTGTVLPPYTEDGNASDEVKSLPTRGTVSGYGKRGYGKTSYKLPGRNYTGRNVRNLNMA